MNQIVLDVMKLHHFAHPSDPIPAQRRAVIERGAALSAAWSANASVQDDYPDGWWEECEGGYCFCAEGPSGHPQGDESGCLFGDGETRSCMCASCRRPCDVETKRERCFQGYYGSAPAYENLMEIRSACCKDGVLLPNGKELEEYEE